MGRQNIQLSQCDQSRLPTLQAFTLLRNKLFITCQSIKKWIVFLFSNLNRLQDSFKSKASMNLLSGICPLQFSCISTSNPFSRRNPSLYYVYIECLLSFSQRLLLWIEITHNFAISFVWACWGCLRRNVEECLYLRGRKQQDAKENGVVRNFMVFIHHEIVLGL
jgi:hypothetical protein